MKHIIILIVALTVWLTTGCQSTGSPKEGNREVVTLQTPAGRAFYLMPVYEDGVTDITINLAWNTQWAFDDKNNPAVPFIGAEAILQGRTTELRQQDVLELFNDKNAAGSVFVRPDHVIGSLSFPQEHRDTIVPVSAELLSQPQFDPRWVGRIQQNFIESLEQGRSNTVNQVFEAARSAIIEHTALQQFLSFGIADAAQTVEVSDIEQWHEQTFTQNALATAVVTGAVSGEDAGQMLDQLLDALPEGKTPGEIPDIAMDFSPKNVLLHIPDAEKTVISVFGRLPENTAVGDIVDAIALNQLVSGGNGPLFDALRTELRATYGFSAGPTNYNRDTRLLFITGEVADDALVEVVDTLQDVYTDFQKGSNVNSVDSVRDNIAQQIAESGQYIDISANRIRELAFDQQDVTLAPTMDEVAASVTLKQVKQRLQNNFPVFDELIIIAGGPDRDAWPDACVIDRIDAVSEC